MRNKIVQMLLAVVLGVTIALVLPSGARAKGLIYQGSSTIGETVIPEAVKVFEAKTGIKFDEVGVTGSSEGFKAVMAGQAAVGGMSRALKRSEKQDKPYYQIIGYDGNAVFVHASNPVNSLTKEQIKGIFTGQISNWKDVGGKDAPITVAVADAASGTVQSFKESALGGADFKATKNCPHPNDCVHYVATDENAITSAAMSFNMAQTKVLGVDNHFPSLDSVQSGSYPFSRPLLLVAKELPKGELKAFFDFMMSPEGQKIVGKFFVPVK